VGIKVLVIIGFFIIFFVSLNSNANLIYNIKIRGSKNILLLNNKDDIQDSLYEYLARSTLDVHAYAKRIVLESMCEEVLTSHIFKLINYFIGKGYRITRSIGHGNEQIIFLRMK